MSLIDDDIGGNRRKEFILYETLFGKKGMAIK